MSPVLFILNDAPYGNERAYNALRLAEVVAGKEGQQVRMFLMAGAVNSAKSGQKVSPSRTSLPMEASASASKTATATCPPGSTATGDFDCWVPRETTRGRRLARCIHRSSNDALFTSTATRGTVKGQL